MSQTLIFNIKSIEMLYKIINAIPKEYLRVVFEDNYPFKIRDERTGFIYELIT